MTDNPDIKLLPTYIQYCHEIADSIEHRGHHPIYSATSNQVVLVNAKDLAAFVRGQAVRRVEEVFEKQTGRRLDESVDSLVDKLLGEIYPPDGVWYNDSLRDRMIKVLKSNG